MNSFYTEEELKTLGVHSYGKNVLISRKASLYGTENLVIGNNVRIDDFCILSGKISIGNFVHISAYTGLWGGMAGIILESYTTISSRCAIYAVSDDYSGEALTNPMVPEEKRKILNFQVILQKYSIIGSGCTVLPGCIIEEGAAIGAMTLINRNVLPWTINVGIPFSEIKKRSKKLLELL
jgi:acetyltransferase-like isoleucine patch superfamily enzyme